MTAYVKEKEENEFNRQEALAAMRRAGSKYTPGTVSALLFINNASSYSILASNYKYRSKKGNLVKP